MAQSAEEVRQEIEATRRDLSRDVDALTEKMSPGRIVQRRVDNTKGRLSALKDKVMGSNSSTSDGGVRGMASNLSSTASSTVGTMSNAPDMARRQTEGNPLAAGLVAFAGGWLVSSLIPASRAEQQAAQAVQDKAADLAEPVKRELSDAAAEMKDNLQPSAQVAVQSVKETATEAASTVKDEGTSVAASVTDDAKRSAQHVRGSGGS